MANLRAALESHFSHPDAELSPSSLAAKRNFGIEALFVELRDLRSVRRVAEPRVKRVLPVPMQRRESVDAENRRRLLALGREVYSDKSFRDGISARLAARSEHAARLTDIQNMRRLAVLDGLFDDGE
jgi:hypothetical protein